MPLVVAGGLVDHTQDVELAATAVEDDLAADRHAGELARPDVPRAPARVDALDAVRGVHEDVDANPVRIGGCAPPLDAHTAGAHGRPRPQRPVRLGHGPAALPRRADPNVADAQHQVWPVRADVVPALQGAAAPQERHRVGRQRETESSDGGAALR